MLEKDEFIAFLKENKGTILTIGSCVFTGLSDVFFIVNSKKLYEKTEREAVDYISAYTLPIALSAGAVACNVLNDRDYKKNIASLAASNAALIASAKTHNDNVVQAIEEKAPEKKEEIIERIDELDGEKLMIEADAAEELNLPENEDKYIYYFKQIHCLIATTPEIMHVSLLNLNGDYTRDLEATLYDLFHWVLYFEKKPEETMEEALNRITFGTLNKWVKDNWLSYGWLFDCDIYDNENPAITFNEVSRQIPEIKQKIVTMEFDEPPRSFDDWEQYYDDLAKKYDERNKIDLYSKGGTND